jgi:hypothetical protein
VPGVDFVRLESDVAPACTDSEAHGGVDVVGVGNATIEFRLGASAYKEDIRA